MSRAYRIRVRESITKTLRAQDRVSTQLEILEILSQEEMAALLEAELVREGFRREGQLLIREEDGVVVKVDPKTGTVTVSAEAAQDVEMEGERTGSSYDQNGPNAKRVEKELREQLRKDLEKQAQGQTSKLQGEVT